MIRKLAKLDTIEQKLLSIDSRLSSVEKLANTHESKFKETETKFKETDTRLTAVKEKTIELEKVLDLYQIKCMILKKISKK